MHAWHLAPQYYQLHTTDTTGTTRDMIEFIFILFILTSLSLYSLSHSQKKRKTIAEITHYRNLMGQKHFNVRKRKICSKNAAIKVAEDEDRKLQRESELKCLKILQEHINAYLGEKLLVVNSCESVKHHNRCVVKGQHDDDYEMIFHHDCHPSLSYEDWVRQCHPENVLKNKRDNTVHFIELSYQQGNFQNKIDHRFYFETSHHRKLWNACVEAHGYPMLKINARSSNPCE